MPQEAFNFLNLFPKFSVFFAGNLNTPQGISSAVVLLLIFLWLVFLGYAAKKFLRSKKHINFYLNLLENVKQEDLARLQRELTQKALSHEHQAYGKLWKEFDETLVFSPDGNRIFNTLEAAHFFNRHNLSMGLTENRLLAAVPGFLTAIGVIGTFAGLQMGLATLEIDQDVGVEILRQGIGNMISGASIAFLTSVWGVFSSVTFNLFEKSMERVVRKRIYQLQNMIDFLYPRINPEQSLVKIADYSRTSTETLQGLAEKIGDRLQEALVQATDNIRTGLEDSLNNIMAPAISSLVDNAQQGSEQALDSLLNRFMDGVGSAGENQRQMMEDTTKDVREAVGNLGNQLSDFLAKLEEQSSKANDEARARQALLEKQINEANNKHENQQNQLSESFQGIVTDLVDKLNSQNKEIETRENKRTSELEKLLKTMVTKSNEAVQTFGGELTKQLEQESKLNDKRHQLFSENVTNFQSVQDDLIERVALLVESQEQGFELVHGMLKELLDPFSNLADAIVQAGTEMFDSAKEIKGVTSQMQIMTNNIRQASDKLSGKIAEAANLTVNLAAENQNVSRDMKIVVEEYKIITESINNIVDKLREATKNAESGFSAVHEHLDGFKKSLSNHVVELDEHIQKLLINYSDQVQNQTIERLNVWNTQTNEYIALMTDAVRALNNVVDELENHTGTAA